MGRVEDCKGDLWTFTAKFDNEKRQHGFDVYNWKLDEIQQGGLLWMGHIQDNLLILAKK